MAGNNLLAAKILRDSNTTKGGTNALAEQFPELYGAIKGLLGTAPDEVGGSVLDGSHQAQKAGAGYGFPIGLLANILPSAAPAINKTASILGKAAEPTVNAFVARTMANGGNPAQLLQDMAHGTTSNMFIGPKAKTWDAAAAAKAEEMTAQGVDPRQIWTETGTWRGPDGKLRQEIDDSNAKLTGKFIGKGDPFTLSDILDHPQLFESYPELAKSPISWYGKSYVDPKGAYLPASKGIEFNPKYLRKDSGGGFTFGSFVSSPSENTGPVLHEVQHAIQANEGFSPGVNATKANYNKHAGEAEARAVESRLLLDGTYRQHLFPEDFYDVPINQLIVRGLLGY